MIFRFIQKLVDEAYARGYQRGYDDGLDESDKRRAAALEKVWATIDDAGAAPYSVARQDCSDVSAASRPPAASTPSKCAECGSVVPRLHYAGCSRRNATQDQFLAEASNVVAIHHPRSDGKWHL